VSGLGTLAASGGTKAYDEYQKAMEELELQKAQQAVKAASVKLAVRRGAKAVKERLSN